MSRKEIVFLSGVQILIIMVIIGNALVFGFFSRWHSQKVFKQADTDLYTFTQTQKKEHDIKEEIRILEEVKSWNETEYAKKNTWSRDTEENNIESTNNILNLLK